MNDFIEAFKKGGLNLVAAALSGLGLVIAYGGYVDDNFTKIGTGAIILCAGGAFFALREVLKRK